MTIHAKKTRGRGTSSKPDARYLQHKREVFHDDWDLATEERRIQTTVIDETARTIISRNSSPDIPFETSINPYRGCEHGCNYCYARPGHAYLDLSPGIDFETRLFAKHNAADLLRSELAAASYRCKPLALGTNTDPYQPIERDHRITRSIIEVLERHRHPLTIVTKSHLIERDLDLLASLASENLVHVFISVTSLDGELASQLEPRASAPWRRIETLKALRQERIPAGVMFAPVIPCINDAEMENILEQCAEAGAGSAGYVLLRLPLEVSEIFREWLATYMPLKKEHVMNMIRDMRSGKDYDSGFHTRMRGTGVFASMIARRFTHACKSLGLKQGYHALDCSLFEAPQLPGTQQSLF